MTTHYEDEAQAERLKQWWKENWLALVGGLVLGLGAIFGWEGWTSYQKHRAEQASRMYEDVKQAVVAGRGEDATRIADQLIAEHARTPYASNAALYLAAEAVKAGALDVALTRLQWVRENGADDGLKQVATLRSARVLWQQGQTDAALALLDAAGNGPGNGPFGSLLDELRGDIRLAQGDRSGARQAYEKALAALDGEDPVVRAGLQRKLDDLADVVQS